MDRIGGSGVEEALGVRAHPFGAGGTDSSGDQPGIGGTEGPLRPFRRTGRGESSGDVEGAASPGTAPNPGAGNPTGKHPDRSPSR